MNRFLKSLVLLALVSLVLFFPHRVPLVAQLTRQHRPVSQMPTLTTLPDFPGIPLIARFYPKRMQDRLVQTLVNNKILTWPEMSSRGIRTGKFTSTGIFDGIQPTEAQIARVAPSYDNILLGAKNRALIPRFKQYNPDLPFFIYVDSGLNPDFQQADAGGVDEEDTTWIVTQHPDWLLRDDQGQPIRSEGGFGNVGAYWPDPGNPEWQGYFVEKINKLLVGTGDEWDGIVFDQFIGTADGHVRYAQANQQVNYPTDEAYQAAYLNFFASVTPRIPVPLIANMEGGAIVRRPAFVAEVALAAGGVENEIFPEEMPMEDLRPYMETIQSLPPEIHVRINSKPTGWAGGADKTLFAYFCYLLIAGKDREVYWTHKEGTSDIPHYWYKEFDLDLGAALGDIDFKNPIWSRSFEKAVVIVNPSQAAEEYHWDAETYFNVKGELLQPPLTLDKRSAMILVKNLLLLKP